MLIAHIPADILSQNHSTMKGNYMKKKKLVILAVLVIVIIGGYLGVKGIKTFIDLKTYQRQVADIDIKC